MIPNLELVPDVITPISWRETRGGGRWIGSHRAQSSSSEFQSRTSSLHPDFPAFVYTHGSGLLFVCFNGLKPYGAVTSVSDLLSSPEGSINKDPYLKAS